MNVIQWCSKGNKFCFYTQWCKSQIHGVDCGGVFPYLPSCEKLVPVGVLNEALPEIAAD